MNLKINLSIIVLLTVFIGACATKVERIDVEAVRDLSGEWNDTDSRLVSEEMIADVLAHPWLGNYTRGNNRQPTVIVGAVRNLSHEHINTRTFVNEIERALINSGKVTSVASSDERDEIREERMEQELHSRADTRKAMGREIGADYMLKGSINTILDVEGKKQIRYYQVDLNLISLVDNTKVWVGQKKIKKYIKKARLRP